MDPPRFIFRDDEDDDVAAPSRTDAPTPLPGRARDGGAALLLALLLAALARTRAGAPEPSRTTPLRIDVENAPWYHFAALEGVGPKTARRWTAVRDQLRAAGVPADARYWPGLGASRLARLGDGPSDDPDPETER